MADWHDPTLDHDHLLYHFTNLESWREKSYFKSKLSTDIVKKLIIPFYTTLFWAVGNFTDPDGIAITVFEFRVNRPVGRSKKRRNGQRDFCFFIKLYVQTLVNIPVAIFPTTQADSITNWKDQSRVSISIL